MGNFSPAYAVEVARWGEIAQKGLWPKGEASGRQNEGQGAGLWLRLVAKLSPLTKIGAGLRAS